MYHPPSVPSSSQINTQVTNREVFAFYPFTPPSSDALPIDHRTSQVYTQFQAQQPLYPPYPQTPLLDQGLYSGSSLNGMPPNPFSARFNFQTPPPPSLSPMPPIPNLPRPHFGSNSQTAQTSLLSDPRRPGFNYLTNKASNSSSEGRESSSQSSTATRHPDARSANPFSYLAQNATSDERGGAYTFSPTNFEGASSKNIESYLGLQQLLERSSACFQLFEKFDQISLNRSKKLNYKDLSEIYGRDFENQPVDSYLFIAIRDLLLKVERSLEGKKEHNVIRDYIQRILPNFKSNKGREFIISELGLIYFYIDIKKEVPCSKLFQKYHREKILKEIHRLSSETFEQFINGAVPYLLHMFCDMSFDSQGKRNIGAIFAVISLLNGELAGKRYLSDEYRTLMIFIFKQLLGNTAFIRRMETPIVVAPSMCFYAKMDLKLGKDEMVTSNHARVACLLALLHDLRQNGPVCYVIGPHQYELFNAPEKKLEEFQSLLQQDTVTFEGNTLPVSPFFIHKIISDFELRETIQLTPDQFKRSTVIQMALKTIGVKVDQLSGIEERNMTLKEFLAAVMESNRLSKESYYTAMCAVISFQKNFMQEYLLAGYMLREANKNVELPSAYRAENQLVSGRPVKSNLIDFIKNFAIEECRKTFPTYEVAAKEFIVEVEQELISSLWLYHARAPVETKEEVVNICFSSSDVVSIPKKSFQSEEDIKHLEHTMKMHRRVLSIRGEKITPLSTFTALQREIAAIFTLVSERRKEKGLSLPPEDYSALLPGFFYSSIFTEGLAIFLARVNHKTLPLKAADYKQSKLLMICHRGSERASFFSNLRNLENSNYVEFEDDEPENTVIKFFDHLSSLPDSKKSIYNQKNTHFLALSMVHSFIFAPYKSATLWGQGKVEDNIEKRCMAPFRKKMMKPFERNQVEHILSEVFKSKIEIDAFINRHLAAPSIDPYLFIKVIRTYIEQQNITELKKKVIFQRFLLGLHTELSKLDSNEIPILDLITYLNKVLKASLDKKQIGRLAQHLKIQLNDTRATPYEFAELMQPALFANRLSTRKEQLERILSEKTQSPATFELGDLNYGGPGSHELLVLKITPFGNILCTRKDGVERVLGSRSAAYKHFSVLYPNYS